MQIDRGTLLQVTTADGETVAMKAIGKPMNGRDFKVVWVCTPEEFDRAATDGDEPNGIPWPMSAVREPVPA